MRGEWYRAHLNDYDTKVYSTRAEKTEDGICITIEHSFGWNMYQPFAKAASEIFIYNHGQLRIKTDAETSNKVSFLPRFGLRFFLSKKFCDVNYYGFGPTESYIDKHQASYVGLFNSSVADLHEDYLRPQ